MKNLRLFLLVLVAVVMLSADKSSEITVWMIGDSTMASKKPERAPESGWGEAMQVNFKPGVLVKNRAASGRSSKSFIDEGRWKNVLDSLKAGDYLVIQFGHNDEKVSEKLHTVAFESFNDTLKMYITKAKAKGAYPIICSSIVRRHFNADGTVKNTHGEYIKASEKAALDNQVSYVNMDSLTRILVEKHGPEASKELFTFTTNKSDSTHLSYKGSAKVASIFVKEIKRQRLPLSKLIK